MSIPNNVLSWSGTMLDMAPNLDAQLQDAASSGFSTILLWSLHVSTLSPYKGKVGGAFVWNSQHIFDDRAPCNGNTASVNDYTAAIPKALQ